MWKAVSDAMSESKAAIFILLGVLVLMTGVFTAFSAGGSGLPVSGSGEDGVVQVNGQSISDSEFTGRVATVEQNLITLTAQAESLPDDEPFVDSLLELIDTTPPETVALASLILDTAIYQEALERGHEPDSDVIRAQVQQERELFEMIEENPEEFGAAPENVAAYRENIDEIGEEAYWNEHYPQVIEQQTAVEELQAEVTESGEDWNALQQEAFRNAEVQINDHDAIAPANIEDAESYMESIWEMSAELPSAN